MLNQTYVASLALSPENTARCLVTMEKYGDNHWWEPDTDPRKYAYYQMLEPTLLGSFTHFHESIELLLGRPVWTHEFAINADTLRQEVGRAWNYQIGVTSEVEKQERIEQSFESLRTWAKENGKQVLEVQASTPESEREA